MYVSGRKPLIESSGQILDVSLYSSFFLNSCPQTAVSASSFPPQTLNQSIFNPVPVGQNIPTLF